MSRQASVLIPRTSIASPSSSDQVITLVAGTAQTITLNKYAVFVINATAAINIAFGAVASASFLVATASNCYSIPLGQQTVFDLGPTNDSISIVATGGAGATVYIKVLAVN